MSEPTRCPKCNELLGFQPDTYHCKCWACGLGIDSEEDKLIFEEINGSSDKKARQREEDEFKRLVAKTGYYSEDF